jgi:hypothetical protein
MNKNAVEVYYAVIYEDATFISVDSKKNVDLIIEKAKREQSNVSVLMIVKSYVTLYERE